MRPLLESSVIFALPSSRIKHVASLDDDKVSIQRPGREFVDCGGFDGITVSLEGFRHLS
jgi:hypothetical protein